MQYIATAKEMKALEKYAMEEMGIPSLVLMERAALGISKEIKGYPGDRIEICVVCGCGNNGADGVAVARQLMEDNYKVDVVFSVWMRKTVRVVRELTAKDTKADDRWKVPTGLCG